MLTYNVLNDYVEKLKKNELTIVSTTDNIRALSTTDINKLRAGDIVLKEDETGKHAYVVSYKKDGTGICMTYTDATYAETISYDYNSVTKEWVYNSMDSIEFVSKSYVDSLMSGALKREIVETLPTEDIDTNTIYMVLDSEASTQGNVYNEYMYINNSWELIGSTAAGSVKKYIHYIRLYCYRNYGINDYDLSFIIISDKNSAYDKLTLFGYFSTVIGYQKDIHCSGMYSTSSQKVIASVIQLNGFNGYTITGFPPDSTINTQGNIGTYNDTNLVVVDNFYEI